MWHSEIFWVLLVIKCHIFSLVNTYSSEIVPFPNNACNKSDYFSVNNIKCVHCDLAKNLVPNKNKLACVCNSLSYQGKWGKEDYPNCINCGTGKVATQDGRFCIACLNITKDSITKTSSNRTLECAKCSADEILVERDLDGTLLPQRKCIKCANGTKPSPEGTTCTPCAPSSIIGYDPCGCPPATHERLGSDHCVPHGDLTAWPDDSATYTIEYPLSGKSLQSALLKNNLRRDIYLCKSQRRSGACQSVANMCVLTHYRDGPACSLFRDFKHIPSSEREPYPWLYYGDGDAPTVLNRRKIPVSYSLDPHSQMRHINLTAVKWAVNGSWGGIVPFPGSRLQLCPGNWISQDAALRLLITGSAFNAHKNLKKCQ